MSVVIHKHLYCDGCDQPLDGAIDGRDDINHQRERAKRSGWVRRRRDGKLIDLCPGCADETPATAPRKGLGGGRGR